MFHVEQSDQRAFRFLRYLIPTCNQSRLFHVEQTHFFPEVSFACTCNL